MNKKSMSSGAPPPFIVHEKKQSEKGTEDNTTIPIRYLLGLSEIAPNAIESNPCGFDVRASSKSGSMTADLFPHYCDHFIRSINEQSNTMKIGPGYRPIFLYLDGHGSRWTIEGLEKLMDNNIWAVILPSKTSIWSQPNDMGVNYKIHKYMNSAARSLRCKFGGPIGDVEFYNSVIKLGWEQYILDEKNELLATKENATTSAFKKTGVYPFDPNCIGWTTAIDTIGKCYSDAKKSLRYSHYSKFCLDCLSLILIVHLILVKVHRSNHRGRIFKHNLK